MAPRDYARRTTSRRSKNAAPAWAWVTIGLLVGLFIAFLVYLQQGGGNKSNSLKELTTTLVKPPAEDTRAVTKPQEQEPPKKREGINYDFYNILPELEVVIPEEELKKDDSSAEESANYYLQVGSFKNSTDAEARKAELFLLNFTPSVQTVTIDGNQTWHRVRIGPFNERRKVDQARRRLQDNGIDFIMLKEKR